MSVQEVITENNSDRGLRWYSRREPVILLVLSTMAVASFLAVSGLSKAYKRQQQELGQEWFTRAVADQEGGDLRRAVTEFEAAQLYARGNFVYQLKLAQTLAALGRTDEAYSYLLNLREQQPDNGTVNLELARILAKKGDIDSAIRYYHDAIYAVWDTDPEKQRRTVRLELVTFLLQQNAKTQAESELIALQASLPPDVALRTRVGNLFLKTQDFERALAEFRTALNLDRRNAAALAGAGRAAFELGRYNVAQRYLESALAANASDADSANLLKTARLVLQLDPSRRHISAAKRSKIVLSAFNTAGERLQTCNLPTMSGAQGLSTTTQEPSLAVRWKAMKPKLTELELRRNPDLAENAMDLVFDIEQQTSAQCGSPQGADLALLLISRLHESNER